MMGRTLSQICKRDLLWRLEETCTHLLKFCNLKSLREGVCVHSPIIKLGLRNNLYLNNNMLSLYAKCFGVEQAHQLFDEMPYKDVVSWTGILSAYVKNGDHEEALRLFDSMMAAGQYPNEFTLSSVMRACSALGELSYGAQILGYIIKSGLWLNPVLGSALIDMFSKCDRVEEAYKIFRYIDNGDVVSWTMMISSFADDGKWNQALQLYSSMLDAGIYPNEFTFAKLLSAASSAGLYCGKMIHAQMKKHGIKVNLVLKTALVDMYSKFHQMDDAIKASNLTPEYDVLLWTAVISAFSQNFKVPEAILIFQEMQISGIMPNNFTYSSILNACSSVLALELGRQIHSQVIINGWENDVSVGNALVDMYMKSSHVVEDALRVFRAMASPNVISWTSLITGLVEHGFEQYSVPLFFEMQAMGVLPNSFTLSSVLGACRTVKSLDETTKLHGYIIKTKADSDIVVGNALVDAYAGLGMFNDAYRVIKRMSHRDAITYTSLATRTNQMGHHEMALNIIAHMRNDNIVLDEYGLATFISASTGLSMIDTGMQLHSHSVKSGLTSYNSVSNGLVDLYGKCGSICDMHKVFGEISNPDIVSWNGLISGLASNGHVSDSLMAFDDMRLGGIEPDSVTFLIVLFACSNGCLADQGLQYFYSMRETYKITPQLDHYICLVDLLGRAGRLEDAANTIETMPFRPNALIYKTLLAACKLHKNITLAEDIARRGLELDPYDPVFYKLLANLYNDCGLFDLGEKTHRLIKDRGLKTYSEQCWLMIRHKVHLFVAGDRSHPHISEIYEKVKGLLTEVRSRGNLYQDSEDSLYHIEKLAVAYGLLCAPSKAPMRVMKNVRMCRGCHSFIMLVTKLVDREIIFKDGTRIHTFKKGECSCRSNW